MALNKFRAPDLPYSATPTQMYYHTRQPFAVRAQRIAASPVAGTASADIAPPVTPPMDMNQLPPEVLQQLQALGAPPQPPTMQGPQGFNLGPFRVPGGTLDAMASAAQSGLQDLPPPRNFGQGLAAGLVGGLAQSRVNQAMGRAQANQTAATDYQKQMDAYRAAASEAGKALAGHRYRMAEIQAELAGKPVTDPMVDVTTPEMGAFFKSVNYKLPPGTKNMKQSELMALGKPSTAAGTAAPGSGVGTNRAYFWGTVQGKGGTVPYGLLRSFKGQDLADFTQGAQDASGGAGGMVGNAANVGALRGALGNITRTKAGFDALDILLDKSTNLLKSTLDKVPDTGTQFGNSFARYWNAQMGKTGTTNFNAVLGPVQTEASRVLTSGTLNGQAITDTARHDLQSLAGGNFTKQQMANALDLLAQERGFRKQGFEQSIAGLKSQLGLPPDSTATPNAPVEGNAAGKARLKARGIQ